MQRVEPTANAPRFPVTERIWFYRPEWYWYGWKTLIPIWRGHDDQARWTVVLGWTITGQIVIAVKDCGSVSCMIDAADG